MANAEQGLDLGQSDIVVRRRKHAVKITRQPPPSRSVPETSFVYGADSGHGILEDKFVKSQDVSRDCLQIPPNKTNRNRMCAFLRLPHCIVQFSQTKSFPIFLLCIYTGQPLLVVTNSS